MNPKNDLGETPTKERDERKEQREREIICRVSAYAKEMERKRRKKTDERWEREEKKGNTGIRRRERKRGGRKIELNGHRRERVERHDDNRLESVLRAFKYHRYGGAWRNERACAMRGRRGTGACAHRPLSNFTAARYTISLRQNRAVPFSFSARINHNSAIASRYG